MVERYPTENIVGGFLMGFSVAALLAIASHWNPEPAPQMPALIGYGCDGASGPIYADEEDYFPFCDNIEPTSIYHHSPSLPAVTEFSV